MVIPFLLHHRLPLRAANSAITRGPDATTNPKIESCTIISRFILPPYIVFRKHILVSINFFFYFYKKKIGKLIKTIDLQSNFVLESGKIDTQFFLWRDG